MASNVRAVIGVIRQQGRYLVIKRASHIRAGGKFCFPGGAIEAGETEEQALLRELKEEINVIARIGAKIDISHSSWGTELNWFHVELESGCKITPCHSEVESVHWMTRDEMIDHPDLLETNLEFLNRRKPET